MSTICKIDPRVREARRRRAQAVRHLEVAALNSRLKLADAAFALAAVVKLRDVKNDPSRSGASKEREFRAIVQSKPTHI